MHQINHLPPDRMTPEQRRHEIASLLANGLARLRIYSAKKSAYIPEASEFELGFSGNQRRIESLVETGKVKKRDRDYRPAAGTVLVREYKGVEYRVIATADGQHDFQGRMYPSLSMIAREITGMRWSGPLFLGLKPPSNAKAKPSTKKRGAR